MNVDKDGSRPRRVAAAAQRGYHEVGWHCWRKNLPSAALARRAGFDFVKDYPVYFYPL